MMKTLRLTTLTIILASSLALPGYTQITNKGVKSLRLLANEAAEEVGKAVRRLRPSAHIDELSKRKKIIQEAFDDLDIPQQLAKNCPQGILPIFEYAVKNDISDKEQIAQIILKECQ